MTRGHTRARMESTFINLGLTFGLIIAAIWFTMITNRLQTSLSQIENGDVMLEEIRESIEIVGQILHRLPELMPQFNMPQTNPLATLIESYFANLTGTKVSKADGPPVDATGRFIDGGTTWKEEDDTPTPSEADAEDSPGN
jgi:hypothetical protein